TGTGRNVFLCVVSVTFVGINIIGIRNATQANNILTVGKLVPLALFLAAGLWFTDWSRFAFAVVPSYAPFSTSVLLLVYAFTGFEIAVIPSGEIRDPQRDIPMALLTGIALIAVIYLLVQVVCIGTLPELASSQRPLADAASRFLGRAGASIISAGVVISIAANLHITLLAAARIPFAMGERGEMPRVLGRTHTRFHTPHYAILFTGAVMMALALSGTFIYALTISTLARLTIYMTTCAALPRLRQKAGAPAARFRVPGGVGFAAAAILLACWLLSNSSWREARDTAIAAVAGLVILALSKSRLAVK
ncbi:MAG: amino acid permease, partial [Bryobacteraceae bacterium]